jgi:hypothetical protein
VAAAAATDSTRTLMDGPSICQVRSDVTVFRVVFVVVL